MNAALTWDVVRASGFAAYGLVTLSIVFGLLLSQRAQSRDHWPRFVNQELHQYTLLLAGRIVRVPLRVPDTASIDKMVMRSVT